MEKVSPQTTASDDSARVLPAVVLGDRRERAQFDALRKETFLEMGHAAARWRLVWIVPFHALVLTLMVARGASPGRAGIQAFALVSCIVLFFLQTRKGSLFGASSASLFIGTATIFITVANTGGLASPLLFTSAPILLAGSVAPLSSATRVRFFSFFVAGFVALAFLSRTSLGELPAPFAPMAAFSSAEYIAVAAAGIMFTATSTFFIGEKLSAVYTRVAFELAARREQICNEGEDRTRALEGIAARLAHEVKNPLAAIKGLSVHMAGTATDPKTAERLSIVAAEADRLQSIVDGVLSFSRGLEVLQLGPTDPLSIARELALLLELRASEVGVTLHVDESRTAVVNADERKIRQALLNLVLNALQASPKGSTVTLAVVPGMCGGIAIQVIDHGAGMSKETLDRIKKPYFTTREGGTGLGIAVARGLIEQHGGKLRFDSELGKGTKVTLELPACASAASKAEVKLPNLGRSDVPCGKMGKEFEEAIRKARGL
jgi:signal transduction histidine kinase